MFLYYWLKSYKSEPVTLPASNEVTLLIKYVELTAEKSFMYYNISQIVKC